MIVIIVISILTIATLTIFYVCLPGKDEEDFNPYS